MSRKVGRQLKIEFGQIYRENIIDYQEAYLTQTKNNCWQNGIIWSFMLDKEANQIQVTFVYTEGKSYKIILWFYKICSIIKPDNNVSFVVDDADELNAEDIAKKLKPFRQLLDDAAVERELEAELQKDYLFASALHGHKMSLVKQDRGPSPPPAPIQHRKIRRSDLNIGKIIFKPYIFICLQ